MKTVTIIIIVDLFPVSLTAKKIKMFPKKSHYYNLINNLTKGIIEV